MVRRDFGVDAMQVAIALAALGLVLLAGCQTSAPVVQPEPPRVQEPEVQPAPPPVPVAPPPIPTPAERARDDGIALYDAGDFNGAIKRLRGAKEIWTEATTPAATANKVTALKYVAFSYCVTKRRTQCRQQFVEALKLDPGFNLEPAERKHPVWGPEFERAKKQASAPASPAKRQAPRAATSSGPGKGP
jgi:hypothetical protein